MITPNLDVETLLSENYSIKAEIYRVQEAREAGMEIIQNSDTTLTFDLDDENALKIFKERYPVLQRKGFSPYCEITRSKSGGYHAKVDISSIRGMSEPLRMVIQACLGSDWKREILGVLRVLNNEPQVSMLFRPQPLQVVEILGDGSELDDFVL